MSHKFGITETKAYGQWIEFMPPTYVYSVHSKDKWVRSFQGHIRPCTYVHVAMHFLSVSDGHT